MLPHCFCSTIKKKMSQGIFGYSNKPKKGPLCLCLFVSALCGWLLTGGSNISRHTSQGSCAGAGHTLVSAQSQVG